jgi:hypothetical protein
MLKLRVGGKYRRRDGGTAEVIRAQENGDYKFRVRHNGETGDGVLATENGRFWTGACDDYRDLIEEIAPELKLQVGKKYRARNGEVSEIYEDRRGHYRGRCADKGWNYEPNGHWCGGGGKSEHDLIAEVGLDLQAGKYYRTRDGRKAFVAAVTSNPFESDSKDHARLRGYIDQKRGAAGWNESGLAFTRNSNTGEIKEKPDEDLIAPWSEPQEVQLNSEYRAVVTDVVQVGCQTFPLEKAQEILDAGKRYKGELSA